MKVGDLVRLCNDNKTIGVVIRVRRAIIKGQRWYYLVEWFSGNIDSCYCSSGMLEKLK